jgi:nifR3 family TIM-barrel protein
MAFRLGNLELATNLCLAPLAGYTNLPFRLTIREIGGVGLCTTDLVNARSLLERNAKAHKLIETCPADQPLAVQLFGSVPEEMRDAAQLLESRGVHVVDVNMGCPVRKVCKVGGGSAMLTDLDRTTHLVRLMVRAVNIPVTCKMRLGWDDDNLTAPDLARALADVGVAGITVHGRTRQQGFTGRVNLAGIRAVVAAVPELPVTGNGDITTPAAAKQMFEATGCAAISIGRGAFYNPWIFQHTAQYLATGTLAPEPSLDDRLAVMRRHLARMIEVFGESVGCRMFRKVAATYARRFGPAAEFKRQLVRLSSLAEFDSMAASYRQWRAQFLDEHHQLRRQYAPPPLLDVSTISVPKGPNELW